MTSSYNFEIFVFGCKKQQNNTFIYYILGIAPVTPQEPLNDTLVVKAVAAAHRQGQLLSTHTFAYATLAHATFASHRMGGARIDPVAPF